MNSSATHTIEQTAFYRSLRILDFSQQDLPPFVSYMEGLTEPQASRWQLNVRWNREMVVRIMLATPVSGKICVSFVAINRDKAKEPIPVTIGGDTQLLSPNHTRLSARPLTFNCRTRGRVIKFQTPGGLSSLGLAYMSIQTDGA